MTKRKRHQKGSLQEALSGNKKVWKALYYDESGVRKSVILGECSKISKSTAQGQLAEILTSVNQARQVATGNETLADYVKNVFIPFGKEKWRLSTASTCSKRLDYHFIRGEFGLTNVKDLTRVNMQAYLNSQALSSRNTINLVKRDFRAICKLACSEGLLKLDQSVNLFIPKDAKEPVKRVLTIEQVILIRSVLEIRARVFFTIAIYAGLRPGEIVALKWSDLVNGSVLVDDRYYEGKRDKTKTNKDRDVALAGLVLRDLEAWKHFHIGGEFIFPSVKLVSPVWYDTIMQKEIRPKLRPLGLEWVDYRVMRRTNASLMHEAKVDAKVSADNRGHSMQVSIDTYTQSSMAQKKEAVRQLEEFIQ